MVVSLVSHYTRYGPLLFYSLAHYAQVWAGVLSISVTLTDPGVDGEVRYKVYTGTDGTDGSVRDVDTTTLLLKDLTPGTVYFVRARAVVSSGGSSSGTGEDGEETEGVVVLEDVEGPWTEMVQIELMVSGFQLLKLLNCLKNV